MNLPKNLLLNRLNIFVYLFIFIICLISIGLTHYSEIHNYDSMHDGQIYYEALKVLNGEKPYEDFYVSHGLFAPYINALIIKVFNSTIYLTIFYNLLFLFSCLLLFLLIKKFSIKLALYSFFIFFLIHPYTSLAWNTYLIFFFLTLGIYLFTFQKNFYFLLSSISFSFCYFSSDSFLYALIIIIIISFFFTIKFFLEKKRRHLNFALFFLLGFFLMFSIYLIVIYSYGLQNYLAYNFTLPSAYFDDKNFAIIYKILFSGKLFLKNAILDIFDSQEWFFFLIFIFNFIFILNYFFFKKKIIENKIIILISLISLLMFYMIIYKGNIFRLMNGVIIGIVPIMYFFSKYNFNSYLKIGFSIIILFLTINFINSHKIKFIQNIDQNNLEIYSDYNFLNKKKLKKNYDKKFRDFEKISLQLKEYCNLEFAVNFSNDAFLSFILDQNFSLLQKSPLLRNEDREFKIEGHINPGFFRNLGFNIREDNLLIYSEIENLNENLASKNFNVNFDRLTLFKLNEDFFVFYPRNCILG